jgi:hypothetical protein
MFYREVMTVNLTEQEWLKIKLFLNEYIDNLESRAANSYFESEINNCSKKANEIKEFLKAIS